MSDITVDADKFAKSLTELLERIGRNVKDVTPGAIDEALQVGEEEWRKNANAVLSKSYSRGGWGKVKDVETYSRGKRKGQVKAVKWYGKTIKTGRYARSIRHHVLTGGDAPSGEIGSPSMPGLAHLLEKGHGYFDAAAHPHIEPAGDKAVEQFEKSLDEAIERAIDDA